MGAEQSQEGRFPFGRRERNEVINKSQESIKQRRIREQAGQRSLVYDSPLETPPEGWIGDTVSFEHSFLGVLPKGQRLQSYIESELVSKEERRGVEFGGPGSAAFSTFPKDFWTQTIGVTLTDQRSVKTKVLDEWGHHEVMRGDITKPETYNRLSQRMNGKRADLVLVRLAGGWRSLPQEPYAIGKMFESWYEMLAEGGILFSDIPRELRPLALAWIRVINEQKGLGVAYWEGKRPIEIYDAVRLNKLKGAPEKLPSLDLQTIRNISLSIGRN